jgi:hypothetical protein
MTEPDQFTRTKNDLSVPGLKEATPEKVFFVLPPHLQYRLDHRAGAKNFESVVSTIQTFRSIETDLAIFVFAKFSPHFNPVKAGSNLKRL